ncbi:protein DpdE [uncultured Jatrophihabitans sp.]|uniref:protein DpdE n=1 Tax=uncultured Jatrophihabitans sp. TaxID=1610747 RepID=UPI0035CC0928
MDKSTRQAVGRLVAQSGAPGFARVGEVVDDRVRLDYFESAARPIAESRWVRLQEVQRVRLSPQTRVFFQDGWGRWRAGRILGGGPDSYHVRIPNMNVDLQVTEDRLRVRWERPPEDPLQVLLTGANETPRYRDAREPVRQLLLAERAATASATGIVSTGVRLHAHQISAALRIIRDPVQRYLLADEVGMGKTIQAGFVMRQLLIDVPGRRIGVIVPDALKAQWRAELLEKFYLDDFPSPAGGLPFEVLGHDEVNNWGELTGADLLVVDEAHLLARTQGPQDSPYRELTDLAHAVPRLLMLSATPFSRHSTTHLALLHLLDPHLFRWDRRTEFDHLLEARQELALAIFGLDDDPDPDNPELLQFEFDEIRRIVPDDSTLAETIEQTMLLFGPTGTDPAQVDRAGLRRAVAAVRTHVSETYRLHHRVIRNRRHVVEIQRLDDQGLLTPFEFAGRSRPGVIRMESDEVNAAATFLAEWAARSAAAVLDDGLEPGPLGQVLGVLASRAGGPLNDLLAAVNYRLSGVDTEVLSPPEKALLDAQPALAFEADLAETLCSARGSDGLQALATALQARDTAARSVVFTGRGTLAGQLVRELSRGSSAQARAHLSTQTEQQREEAEQAWRTDGGMLIVDDSGEVGRNFQGADAVYHIRIPWNPNALEQRIGRVDRYSTRRAGRQFVVVDPDPHGIVTTWLKVLADGFVIFTESLSAMQEIVGDLAGLAWTQLVEQGVEGFLAESEAIHSQLIQEKRRINEVDALEASYGTYADGDAMTLAIAEYEAHSEEIERAYRSFVEGPEGLRLAAKTNLDGSIQFGRHPDADPLVSGRLLTRLMTVEAARTGYFDRWKLAGRRRLFRRGNPFISGLESLLSLDDRGQAVAMWRVEPRWHHEPTVFFGFDFLIEADIAPVLAVLAGNIELEPICRRRADAAFRPQHHRIWIPTNTAQTVGSPALIELLSRSYSASSDKNLNSQRIAALHAVLGGEENLAPFATACHETALQRVTDIADVVEASRRAGDQVRRQTDSLLAQSRARSHAGGLVTDPSALDTDVALGRALEAAVTTPAIRLSTVSCVVLASQPWGVYV